MTRILRGLGRMAPPFLIAALDLVTVPPGVVVSARWQDAGGSDVS